VPSILQKFPWYWHRLRAMGPNEIALRLQKKAHQLADAKYKPLRGLPLEPQDCFPRLPKKMDAPGELLAALERNVTEILRGDWRAFGHLPISMGDPPRWHFDNLVGQDRKSSRVFFKLDHRAQPGGADIKVIWEPSRWYQLVRLAMAAWLLDHSRAQEKCVEWLHDWARNNPPFRGLNWTSGLETGIRLIQYTWIDSFLSAAGVPNKTLDELRRQILPPHLWYTWRYKSFGSSANNHLIGELAGIILTLARWPELSKISAPLKEVAALWEKEILAQFAEDGGNNEQALGYHLFSWEFCWQTQRAIESAGSRVSERVTERLIKAGRFYSEIRPENDNWDYGDSDNAFVTPLFAEEANAAREWWRWFNHSASSAALQFWWGDFSRSAPVPGAATSDNPARSNSRRTGTHVTERPTTGALPSWQIFSNSGYAVFRSEDWFARFDFSPLGYLSMAPHGHADALHLSVWFRAEPLIIDPGTGAYYAEKRIRNYLASWAAHNSPHLRSAPIEHPRRLGTFLWGPPHAMPGAKLISPQSILAEITLPYGRASRKITFVPETNSLRIEDSFLHPGKESVVATRWKFAPASHVKSISPGEFRVTSNSRSIWLRTSTSWKMTRSYNPPSELFGKTFSNSASLKSAPLDSIVSPAFRHLATSAYLVLEANGEGPFELMISPG
jgi:hypothetical protein